MVRIHRLTRALATSTLVLLTLGACQLQSLEWPHLNSQGDQVASSAPVVQAASPDVILSPTEERVSLVQRRLSELGYQPGPVDGVFGPRTEAAILAFNAEIGRAEQGQITEALLADLADARRERTLAGDMVAGQELPKAAPRQAVVAVEPQAQAAPAAQALSLRAPSYLAGSRYVYSNGDSLRLREISGDQLTWRSDRGYSITSYRNFVLPPLTWSQQEEQGSRRLVGAARPTWPFGGTAVSNFRTKATLRIGRGPGPMIERDESWSCRALGEETIEVPAGQFTTQKLTCRRAPSEDLAGLQRTWYYAAALGHVVRRLEREDGQTETQSRDLVAVEPDGRDWPPAAKAGLGWAFQHAMEFLPDGESAEWRSSGVDAQVTIQVGARLDGAAGQVCRRYRQDWVLDGDLWQFPGLACRNAAGEWQVPGDEVDQRIAVNPS